ncbi:MAG TPA: PAS domain-containing sensor histidine kinase [Burkholderiales bacterium]|nr:PAS domain-containing sensor histidine kinase [Burkholderiales bacterium]
MRIRGREAGNGQGYALVAPDLKQGSQAREARREHELRLDGIIQSAMDAIITIDEGQNVVLFNAAAERIFRCSASDAIGTPLDRFIPHRFRAAHRRHIERFAATGETMRMMGARMALSGLRSDGTEFPIDASISQIVIGGRRLLTVILRDITDRKSAEEALERSYEELREMSAAMHEVREAERTRIARELHDELAQSLTAIKMDVAWLSSRLAPGQEQLLARTGKMKALVDATITSVRRLAADLRPVMLDDLGLVPSLEHLLHALSERANVAVSLDVRGEATEFKDPLATGVYRIVQEALTNVARHARATEVSLLLRVEDGMLGVQVKDNGVGLRAAASERKSYGIVGIRERAQTLGGTVRIYSPESGGTVVEISIPLARYLKAEAGK